MFSFGSSAVNGHAEEKSDEHADEKSENGHVEEN